MRKRTILGFIALTGLVLLYSNCHAQESMKEDHVRRLIKQLKSDKEDLARDAGISLSKMGSDPINALVNASRDKNWGKRHRAIYVLGHCGKAAIPHLYKILENSQGLLQSQAISGLRRIGHYDHNTLHRLSPHLKSANPVVRECAEQILLDQKSSLSLLHLLRANPKRRADVKTAFIELGQKSHPTLLELLSSKDEREQELATGVLARNGQTAISELKDLLHKGNRTAAFHALRLLLSFGRESKLSWADLQPSLESTSLRDQALALSALTILENPRDEILATVESKLSSISLELRCIAALTHIQKTKTVTERSESILHSGLSNGDLRTKTLVLTGLPTLPKLSVRFLPSLLMHTKVPQEDLRWHALKCLRAFRPVLQGYRDILVQSLHEEPSPKIRALYLDRLSELDLTGVKDTGKWLEYLKDNDPGIQQKTLYCLSKMGAMNVQAQKAVAHCLSSQSPLVKQNAIVLLTHWKTNDPEILRQISACLGDANPELRNQAGRALLTRSSASLVVMRKALTTTSTREKSNLISLLGRLKDTESKGAIESCLFAKEPTLRLSALMASAELKNPSPKAARQILKLADKDPVASVRQIATQVKQRLGLKKAKGDDPKALIAQFQSKDTVVRYRVLSELIKLSKKAVPALVTGLTDSNVDIRYHCAGALELLAEHSESAVPALSKALKDPEKKVREAARKALAKILKISK